MIWIVKNKPQSRSSEPLRNIYAINYIIKRPLMVSDWVLACSITFSASIPFGNCLGISKTFTFSNRTASACICCVKLSLNVITNWSLIYPWETSRGLEKLICRFKSVVVRLTSYTLYLISKDEKILTCSISLRLCNCLRWN